MTEYNETVEDNNVGICIDCKYYRARQKRERYPHCTCTSEAMILRSEQIHCKKYEWKGAMTDYERGYKDGMTKVATQLAEAKKLLKLAIEDLERCDWCSLCKYNDDVTCVSAVDNCFVWKHADEAMKLIGEEGGNNA